MQPTSQEAGGDGHDGQRHVVFAADVAAGRELPEAFPPASHAAAAEDSAEALPASTFTAPSSTFLADSDLAASILRSRPSAVGDGTGMMSGIVEVENPLSRGSLQPTGLPVLRRSGTSLAPDGTAFAAIDMPELSRQASLLADDAAADAAGNVPTGSAGSCSTGSSGMRASSQDADAGSPCFGRMRPSVAIALSALCLIAAVSMLSAWLPESVHTAAHAALQKAMPQQYIFEPRQDVVVIFKQDSALLADLHTVCGRTHAGAQQPVHRHPVSPTCNLAKACSHVFGSVIHGIAGRFTRKELALLQQCLPSAMHYMEADAPVQHMMDSAPPAPNFAGALAAQDSSANVLHPISSNNSNGTAGTPASENVVTAGVDQQLVPGSPPVPSVGGAGFVGPHNQSLQGFQWNLDRVCKKDLPLNHVYTYGTDTAAGMGENVTIYIVDSGLQTALDDFKSDSGVSRASPGWNAIDSNELSDDCFGHGSAVASIAAGTIFGVAKGAKVVGVRVLDCNGKGSVSNAIAGLDWVAGHIQKPAVVALSLGLTDDAESHALDQAVNSIITNLGVPVVAAAGNGRISACSIVPANVPAAITVAATNLSTKFDNTTSASDAESMYRFSNYGPCIDISCPGVDIPFACSGLDLTCATEGNISYSTATGTSFAAPHVAGVAAIFLGEYPNSTAADVKTAILTSATRGKLMHSAFPLRGTPDLLAYSQGVLQSTVVADSNAVDSSAG